MLAGVHEYCHVDRSPTEHAIGVFRCPRRQIARVKAIKCSSSKSNLWGRILEKTRWAVNHARTKSEHWDRVSYL